MAIDNAIPISEAASILKVHPSRVRAMVNVGQLDAEKLAGRWFVERSSLERRRFLDSPDGRPFSPINAWALLCLAEGKGAEWVDKSARSRLRGHLRRRSWEELVPRLRSRARPVRLRGHPSALGRLANESGIILAGVSAASRYGIDIQPSEELEVYVYQARAGELIQRYKLEASDRPNVVFRVVSDDVPADWQECLGGAVAAIDLVESPDARSRRAGVEYLNNLVSIRGEPGGHSAAI